ncbi:MAG: tetratricopeptide repeat protein [Candidatus Eisenbacteria bacterium]|uniref:Tetratricopeptide repeat protein n=1 Tax=Eiseniibacteriota bacterium TaxID=2212470 RepID=A0A956M0N4_UNCEI|nr:tetratricopeptide repeat protein [Candidatus Eisenbacteria bacterium]
MRGFYLQEVHSAPDYRVPHVDAAYHDYWARALAFGYQAPPRDDPDPELRTTPYFRPPGYPFLLAAIYKVAGPDPIGPRVVQMVVGLLNVLLGWVLARQVCGRGAALVTASWLGTYWIFPYFEGELQEPAFSTFFLLGLLHVLWRWQRRQRVGWILAAGIVVGVLALIRPNALLLIPVLWGWLAWIQRSDARLRSRLVGQGLAMGLAATVVIAPVTIRNWVVGHQLVPISANGGINLYIGNNADADGTVRGETPYGVLDTCYDWPGIVKTMEMELGRPVDYQGASREFSRMALDFILAHPDQALRLAVRKTIYYWGPSEPGDNREVSIERKLSPSLRANPWDFGMTLALAICGVMLFVRERRRSGRRTDARSARERRGLANETWQAGMLWLAVALLWWVSYLPFAAGSRYRVPTIPILFLFGGWFAVRFGWMVLSRQARTSAAWGATLLGLIVVCHVNLIQPGSSYARWHYQRAMSYWELGDKEAALQEYQTAASCNPKNPAVQNDLGVALASLGRIDEAIPHFQRALERNRKSPAAHFNLGTAYESKQWYGEAASEYRAALQLDPGHVGARDGLERVRRLSAGVSRSVGTGRAASPS